MTEWIKWHEPPVNLHDDLARAFSAWGECPTPLLAELSRHARRVNFIKGETVMDTGATDHHLYWLEQGLWRVFYVAESGREFIKAFIVDGMFFVAFNAFLQQRPSAFMVQALEDSRAIQVPYSIFYKHVRTDAAVAQLWRCYMEQHFIRHEERERILLLSSGAERYQYFLKEYPGMEKRIPQYHIASYLGLTEQSLSRLKKHISQGS